MCDRVTETLAINILLIPINVVNGLLCFVYDKGNSFEIIYFYSK